MLTRYNSFDKNMHEFLKDWPKGRAQFERLSETRALMFLSNFMRNYTIVNKINIIWIVGYSVTRFSTFFTKFGWMCLGNIPCIINSNV